jgi:hypothetical protein
MVTCCSDLLPGALAELLEPLGLAITSVAPEQTIPGSFWGDPEAGLIRNRLYVRPDTPVHSALHEAGHYLCADAERQDSVHTDAGGDDPEEAAVCYLQVLLADHLRGYTRQRLFADMDAWGYSYRLGSAQAWFMEDASDALNWLEKSRESLLQQLTGVALPDTPDHACRQHPSPQDRSAAGPIQFGFSRADG